MDTEENLKTKGTDQHMDQHTDQHTEPPAEVESQKIEAKDEISLPKKVKRQATQEQLDHPLHGVKLAEILEGLVDYHGWEYLADEVNIHCFKHNPSMKVSLKFLRKFKWAREHVQDLYLDMVGGGEYRNRKR